MPKASRHTRRYAYRTVVLLLLLGIAALLYDMYLHPAK